MAIRKVNPYLNFNGTAGKAIKHYESALGAKTEQVMRYADAKGMPVDPAQKDWIMHSTLRIGDAVIMISDSPPHMAVTAGSNVHVSLDFDDVADQGRKFDALAAGGKVTVPLQDMFWGARFGMLTDAYGINWMFNCELKK